MVEIPVLVLSHLSMVNGFILEKLAGKKKRRQLDFRRKLAKLLITGYNGYKRPSNSEKRAVSTFTTEKNLRGHFLGKLEGQKRACAMCAKAGRKRKEGQDCTFETSYACEQCGVPLCHGVKGLALLNQTKEAERFLYCIIISLLFLLQCSLFMKMIACSLHSASLVDHCLQMNTTDLLHCSVTFIAYNQNN